MRLQSTLAFLVTLLCAVVASAGIAAEHAFPELNFAVTTSDEWSVADPATLNLLTHATSPAAIVHARLKGAPATAKAVDSAALLLYSKLPLGTPGDNPNVVLAKEKAWAEDFEKSGAGYVNLMKERVGLTRAPTKFVGEPKAVKVGDIEFHQIDAINTKVPAFETKQRYLCTFKDGYYVYFVLSYNEEDDADFQTMMEFVTSFRIVKR